MKCMTGNTFTVGTVITRLVSDTTWTVRTGKTSRRESISMSATCGKGILGTQTPIVHVSRRIDGQNDGGF